MDFNIGAAAAVCGQAGAGRGDSSAGTKETWEQIVKPAVAAFLAQRGLGLSDQKTTIPHIQAGFDFLGQNERKHGNKLVMRPAKTVLRARAPTVCASVPRQRVSFHAWSEGQGVRLPCTTSCKACN